MAIQDAFNNALAEVLGVNIKDLKTQEEINLALLRRRSEKLPTKPVFEPPHLADGCFDDDKYAVWERDDVIQLINMLQRVVDGMPNPDRELRKVEIASLSGVLEVKDEVREFDLTQYPNLPPYQLRVIEEYKRVATDCLKLSEFIKGEVFYTVNEEERSRLISQRSYMRQYAGVLLERIDAFLATS